LNTQPTGAGFGKDFWQAEVTKMIKVYGAPISEGDAKLIVDYLAVVRLRPPFQTHAGCLPRLERGRHFTGNLARSLILLDRAKLRCKRAAVISNQPFIFGIDWFEENCALLAL
jgi:hypothetical protein